jgi:hypothetical protein
MDCTDEEAAVLGPAVAASIARQTGKRVLLVDGLGAAAHRFAGHPGRTAPSLAELLDDKSLLARHEAERDLENGLDGARVAAIGGEDGLTEDQQMAALDTVMRAYDFVLLAGGRGRQSGPQVLSHARSVLALVTPDESGSLPSWLSPHLEDVRMLGRLEIAMLTGDRRGLVALEQMEDILGRAVVRLPLSRADLHQMAQRGRPAAEDQAGIDRLARLIGEIEVGVALGAGAAKGFAHIGPARSGAARVPIDYLAGCSIGRGGGNVRFRPAAGRDCGANAGGGP